MDPVSVGIGAAGSLAGGVMSFFGQNNANKTNLQIARETNAQNYKIWQESMQHDYDMFDLENQAAIDMFNLENQANIDMWNMQNAYNDPSAQVERMLAAGLNPYVTDAVSAGNATGSPGTGSLNPATMNKSQAPTMLGASVQDPVSAGLTQALNYITGLAKASLDTANTDKTKTETVGLQIDNKYREENWQNILASQRLDNTLKEKTQQFDIQIKQEQLAIMNAQKVQINLDNDTKRILNEYLPAEKQIGLAIQAQELAQKQIEYKMSVRESEFQLTMFYYRQLQAAADVRKTNAEAASSEKSLELMDSQISLNEANAGLANENARGVKFQNDMNDEHKTELYSAAFRMARANIAQAKLSEYTAEEDLLSAKFNADDPVFQTLNHLTRTTGKYLRNLNPLIGLFGVK